MPNKKYQYLSYLNHYFDEVAAAWNRYFSSIQELRDLFEAIATNEEKDLFLRVGSFYRYLVVEGKFSFDNNELNQGLSFIDDTYKYVAMFALIEALETPPRDLDFYEWLQHEKVSDEISQHDNLIKVLEPMYRDYKSQHGSIQAAVRFFCRLDEPDQKFIQEKLQHNKRITSLKKLAQDLYEIRSKFVHQARLDLIRGFGCGMTGSVMHNGHALINKMTMEDFRILFERGFLKRFGWQSNTQRS
jgi:hypothetical protein